MLSGRISGMSDPGLKPGLLSPTISWSGTDMTTGNPYQELLPNIKRVFAKNRKARRASKSVGNLCSGIRRLMKTNDAVGSLGSLSHEVTPQEKTYQLPEFTQNELMAVVEAIETLSREQNFVSADEKKAGVKVAGVLLANNLVSPEYARYLRHTYGLRT
jgi:hypothetical protein